MIDMEFILLHSLAISFFWVVAVITLAIKNYFRWDSKVHSIILLFGAYANFIMAGIAGINLLIKTWRF